MKNCLYKLLFYSYSTGYIFCKKKDKEQEKNKVQDNNKPSVILNKNNDTNTNNSSHVNSLKKIIENYPELACDFLDNVKAINFQNAENTIVNLKCKKKENLDLPKENNNNNSKEKKGGKKKKICNKKKKNEESKKDEFSIKKITKYDNLMCQGFFVSNDGYIIADYSLIKGYDNISIIDPKDINKEIPATIVGYDEYLSLILLKADIKVDKFIGFTEYDKSKKFKYVQAINKGLFKVDGYTEVEFDNEDDNKKKKKGKKDKNISNKLNTKTFNSYSNSRNDIKTSVLINVDGYLVGMSVYDGKFVNNSISNYMSILPYNYIYKAINEFISKKYYVHDYNIFSVVSIDERIKAIKRLKLNKGCVVETVSPRLEKCGLKVNDIIVEINGNAVNNVKEFDYLFKYFNSDDIKLKVNREGNDILLTLKDGICGSIKYEYINNGIVVNNATLTNIDKVSMDLFNRSNNFKGGVLISNITDKNKWNCDSNFVITKIKDINVRNVDDVVRILKMINNNYKSENNFDGISLLIEGFYTKDINNKKCFGILIK